MTSTESPLRGHTDIPTAGDKVDYHRDVAMVHADQVIDLSRRVTGEGNADRGLNQLIGIHLKLADVHARLAVAVSQSATIGATQGGLS